MNNLFNEKEFMEITGGEYIETSLNHILWTKYDFYKKASRPPDYGRYFIMRKDGKVHWEVFNGTSFAYNDNSIIWWAKIELPIIKETK